MNAPDRIFEKLISANSKVKRSLFFLLIILPGLFIGYYSYISLRDQLDKSMFDRKASIASLSATIVNERLTYLTRLGKTYTSRLSVRKLIKAGKWDEAIEIFREIEASSPNIDRLFLADKNGTVWADSPVVPGAKGNNFAHRNWYRGLVKNNFQPYISKAYKRILAPQINVVNASFPIKTEEGEVLGILVIQLQLAQFKTWSERKELEPGEIIYIVDQAGQLISGPGADSEKPIIDYSKGQAVPKVLQGKSGVEKIYSHEHKQELLVAYAPVPGYNWGVVVAQPFAQAFVKRNASLASVLIIFGIIFLLNILFAYLIIHNMGKLRRTKEMLRKNEERYALALKGTNDGLWDWDVTTNKVFFSARWKSMLGYAEDEFPNTFEAWKERLHPEDVDRAMATIQAYFDKKTQIYESEYRLLHKDGTYRWILARGMALWNKDGQPYRMIGSHTDLTERKRLEDQREQAENFLSSIVENVPIMLFVKDARDLRMIRWNKASEEITGINAVEIIGKTDYDFFPKEQAEFFVSKDREVLNTGQLFEVQEEPIDTRHKGTRTLRTKKIPIMDQAGKALYLLGISEDITEKKKAEAKILELNNALEIQVKQLEKTNKELKDVTHIISHDLKAPLRGIEMLGQWLLSDCTENLSETCRNNIVVMNERVNRMHNLIEGILRYAHIGRTTGEKEELNLNALIAETVDLITPPENIQIITETEMPVVVAEKAPLQQLFQNLISNAVKYIDKPQGIVKIGATEEGNFWKFYVSDNGPGIEEEYFQRIFQLFQTLQARDEFESTGIGLTIVKKVVENFGGKIWLESKPGEGTTFYFTLPKEIIKSAQV
jgi:PAS domain S-box-containing protein